MIIDCNCYLGRWGIRTKGIESPEKLIRIMDENKIDISIVTSTVGLVTDTKDGNFYLIENIKKYEDRLIPVLCINPIWGVEEVKNYFKIYDFKIVRLSPSLHNYSLQDHILIDEIIDFLIERKTVLYITHGICPHFSSLSEKIGFYPPVYPLKETIELCEKISFLKIVICGYSGELQTELKKILIPALKKCENLFIETSNIIISGRIEDIVKEVPEKVLFGSGCGIIYPSGNINKIKNLSVEKEKIEMIFSGNIKKIIRI